MGHIIFDLLIILGNIWVVFDKDVDKPLKRLALTAIILLVISVTIQVLGMIVIL